jgi:hypothetical protein
MSVRAAYAGTDVSVVGEVMSGAVRLSYQSVSERFPASWLSCDLCFERNALLVDRRSQAATIGTRGLEVSYDEERAIARRTKSTCFNGFDLKKPRLKYSKRQSGLSTERY